MTDTPETEPTEVVQDGTGLPQENDGNLGIIDHGHGVKSKWSGRASGSMPPNPPIEVQPHGDDSDAFSATSAWAVVQQRTGTMFFQTDFKERAVGYATRLAQEHKTELIVKNSDGVIAWRNSYGNDDPNRPG